MQLGLILEMVIATTFRLLHAVPFFILFSGAYNILYLYIICLQHGNTVQFWVSFYWNKYAGMSIPSAPTRFICILLALLFFLILLEGLYAVGYIFLENIFYFGDNNIPGASGSTPQPWSSGSFPPSPNNGPNNGPNGFDNLTLYSYEGSDQQTVPSYCAAEAAELPQGWNPPVFTGGTAQDRAEVYICVQRLWENNEHSQNSALVRLHNLVYTGTSPENAKQIITFFKPLTDQSHPFLPDSSKIKLSQFLLTYQRATI